MAKLLNYRSVCISLVVLQTIIFGGGSAITKIAYESMSPWWCLVFRFGLASLCFLPFLPSIVKNLKKAHVSDWLPAALGMAISYIASNIALDLTTATNVGFLVALPVMFTPFIAWVVLRRRYNPIHLPFQVAVIVGLFFLCSNAGAFSFGLGEFLALVGSVGIAAALVFGEKGLARLDAASISFTQIFVTFILSCAGVTLFDQPPVISAIKPEAWMVVAYLGIASTAITFALQNIALTRLPSFTVSMLLTGEPIFTAIFSYLVLGETLSVVGLLGAAIIVVCVVAETYIDGRLTTAKAESAPSTQVAHGSSYAELLPDSVVVSYEVAPNIPRRHAYDPS